MGFKERLKEARLLNNMTQEQIAEQIGVAKSTFTGYEKGNSEPNMLTISKIINVLKVDANYLWQDYTDFPLKVSYNEMKHIEKYRFVTEHSPEGVTAIDAILNREYSIATQLQEKENYIEKLEKEIIPKRILAYYGKIAAAGKSYGFDDISAGTIECPLTDISQSADYTIGVSGNSMEPTYHDGDIVYVQKTTHLNIGDIGIFQKDNGIYIKEVGESGLISHNKEYTPMVNGGTVICLGKVLGKIEE